MSKQVSKYSNSLARKIITEAAAGTSDLATQAADAQVDQATSDTPGSDEEFDQASFAKNFKIAIDKAMVDLPNDLRAVAKNDGNKDGELQLEVAENQQQFDEALGMLAVGLAVSGPAIAKMMGKLTSFVGKKLDSKVTQSVGDKVAAFGEKWHKGYEAGIAKFLRTMMSEEKYTDEQVKKAASRVFLSIIAAAGILAGTGAVDAAVQGKAGFAGMESILSSIKGTEIGQKLSQKLVSILTPQFG